MNDLKDLLEEFIGWAIDCGEDVFYIFEETDEAINRFFEQRGEESEKQFAIHSVGSSLPKVCKGCGSLSTKVIDKKYLACCPDSNYIPLEDYCKNSIYIEKQF